MLFYKYDGIENIAYKYDDRNINNIFKGKSITMTFIYSNLLQIYHHNAYNPSNPTVLKPNCSNNINRDNYHMRINWLYLGKYLSKPKYFKGGTFFFEPGLYKVLLLLYFA